MNCRFCGAELLVNSYFCVKCGKNNNKENEDKVNERKAKIGFFSSLFKRKENKDEVNEDSKDNKIEQVYQSTETNNYEERVENLSGSEIYFDLSEETEYDLIQKYNLLCDNLNESLRRLKYELEEICEKTRFIPILNIVNETIIFFSNEVYSVADKAFEEWIDSPNSFTAVTENAMVGESVLETAIGIEHNIRYIFDEFWSSHAFREVLNTNTLRPNVNGESVSKLKNLYTSFLRDIEFISEKTINDIIEQGKENTIYSAFLPAVKAIIDPIRNAFEHFYARIDDLGIQLRHNMDTMDGTSEKEHRHPIRCFLIRCSEEITLVPGDKNTKVDLINLSSYEKIMSLYYRNVDIDVVTRKGVEILNEEIEKLCRHEDKNNIGGRIQILRYKIFRRSIQFFADKYNGRKPETTVLSYTFENIYASISLNVVEYKHFCETKMCSIEKEQKKCSLIDNGSVISDLKTIKVIGQTDIKYNICTFGAKFHIGFGVQVVIQMGDNIYRCKTHNGVKGRIDGLKKFYSENNINLGDRLEAKYISKDNMIIIKASST